MWLSHILFCRYGGNLVPCYKPVSSSAKKRIDLSQVVRVPGDNTRHGATNLAVCGSVRGVAVPTQHPPNLPQSTSNTPKLLEASALQNHSLYNTYWSLLCIFTSG